MKKRSLLFAIICFALNVNASNPDSAVVSKIYDEILEKGKVYENLHYLCKNIGPRLSGSANAQKAVDWTKSLMETYGFDRVYLQEVMVPHWDRGVKETAYFKVNNKKQTVAVAALGGSVATIEKGIEAGIIEVYNFDQLKELGEAKIKGKIVFFNRPMNSKAIRTFNAYRDAVNQRSQGATEAAKYGAIGVIVRSMTTRVDEFPHTGSLHYDENVLKIPAVAIATKDANQLSEALKLQPSITFFMKLNCKTLPETLSYNVIGEIKGSEFPNQIITVGGHLDSWDLAEGAQDDGAGTMQSVEVLRTLKSLGVKPKHTIRTVLFMNEENGLRGGLKYAENAKQNGEQHLAAIESDSGGFTPRGFSVDASTAVVDKILSWKSIFDGFDLNEIGGGGGTGSDIGPLKPLGTALFGFRPDSQRYFDFHHAANDVFENVNERELKLGAAAMTALVYLIDQNGLN
ncbi:M20/M25/M40 family metallo-hydrolase [Solitalea sp. MAHUQ-68]|uniref:Carboxypeptidase Q n=1 Tax=Solitalea agri TaxID=2953739 RepID=A0A9X2JCM2_9SPHI|nr:M20/M25/M40 family metallo-hydrolase [Solitalea agri]MCO4292674.1 M20/M25/M40 family metallo-hydrolase [Solitalea agri]